ncbi:MAG: DUF4091 domain-containing protein [bacterium]|nr:DUF4091 domain-containing protein [bacterium]
MTIGRMQRIIGSTAIILAMFTCLALILDNRVPSFAVAESLTYTCGFEDGLKGWEKLQTGTGQNSFEVYVDKEAFHDNSPAVSIRSIPGAEADYAWISRKGIPVEKGEVYKLSLYVKAGSITGVSAVHLHWPNKRGFDAYDLATGTNDWKEYELSFIAQADSLDIALLLSGKGQVRFDDLRLRKSSIQQLDSKTIIRKETVFNYTSRRPNPDKPLAGITPNENKKGYIVFRRAEPRDVYPDSIPARTEVTAGLQIKATPGEYEPAWFSLYALKDLKCVKLTILDDLRLKGGKDIIGKENIDLRTVKCRPQRTSWASKSYYVIPELLEKKDSIEDVVKGNAQTFWLTLRVPAATAPGEYSTRLLISATGGGNTVLPLKLSVLPFKLESPPDRYWAMWTSDHGYDKMSREELRRELADMKEHGINSVLFFAPGLGDIRFTQKDGQILFFSPKLAEIQALRRELKLDGPLFLYWAGELETQALSLTGKKIGQVDLNASENREVVKKAFLAVDCFIKDTGGEDCGDWYYLGWDEPQIWSGGGKKSLYEHCLAKEAGVKSLVTINEGELLKKLSPYLTGICWGGAPESGDVNRLRKLWKQEYWWYGSGVYDGQEGGIMPNRYLCGFLFYKTGAKGQVSFIYTRMGVTGDPYDDFDGEGYPEPKDGMIVYPSADGPVPTLQWEGIREGIDDYKYVYTLETLISDAKRNDKSKILAEKLEKRLSGIMASCRWGQGNINSDNAVYPICSNHRAQSIREECISLILQLIEKL